ncbi:hypothetical protein KPH14_007628 [Odynerus spinipes]|uniref:Uncharacterized protein n=1 Tax=Odynerus spinipes TaxID=1348599 RepID=A0AAD9VMF1_9HYME|nr:hypothetical protein KPH14_007628 [Odynerus spinipes]
MARDPPTATYEKSSEKRPIRTSGGHVVEVSKLQGASKGKSFNVVEPQTFDYARIGRKRKACSFFLYIATKEKKREKEI